MKILIDSKEKVIPTASASMAVAIASINIVFHEKSSFCFSSSKDSLIILIPINASNINAIQWSIESTKPLNVEPRQ